MSSTASPKADLIGMGQHNRSVTIEVMAANQQVLDEARFDTDPAGFAAMLTRRSFRRPGLGDQVCAGIGRTLRPV